MSIWVMTAHIIFWISWNGNMTINFAWPNIIIIIRNTGKKAKACEAWSIQQKQVDIFPYLKTRRLCVLLHYLNYHLYNSTVKTSWCISLSKNQALVCVLKLTLV